MADINDCAPVKPCKGLSPSAQGGKSPDLISFKTTPKTDQTANQLADNNGENQSKSPLNGNGVEHEDKKLVKNGSVSKVEVLDDEVKASDSDGMTSEQDDKLADPETEIVQKDAANDAPQPVPCVVSVLDGELEEKNGQSDATDGHAHSKAHSFEHASSGPVDGKFHSLTSDGPESATTDLEDSVPPKSENGTCADSTETAGSSPKVGSPEKECKEDEEATALKCKGAACDDSAAVVDEADVKMDSP